MRRLKYGVLATCNACRGLGWRMRRNRVDGAGPCPRCKGEPCAPSVKVLADGLPCSESTARRILDGKPISLDTLGKLAALAERVEAA